MASVEELKKQIQEKLEQMEKNNSELVEQQKKCEELNSDILKDSRCVDFLKQQEKRFQEMITYNDKEVQHYIKKEKDLTNEMNKEIPTLHEELHDEIVIQGSTEKLPEITKLPGLTNDEQAKAKKRYNGLLKTYGIQKEQNKQTNPMSNVGSDEANYEYYQDIDSFLNAKNSVAAQREKLALESHRSSNEHNLRGKIKDLIKNDSENKYDHKKTFSSLKKDAINNPIQYRKAITAIQNTVSKDPNPKEKLEYLEEFNKYALENAKVVRTEELLKKLGNDENKKAKDLKELSEEQKKIIYSVTVNDKYYEMLDEKGNSIKKELKKEKDEKTSQYDKASIKYKAYQSIFQAISTITDHAIEMAATIEMANIKGEMETISEKIKKLNDEIKSNKETIEANNEYIANKSNDIRYKTENGEKNTVEVLNGVTAGSNDQINIEFNNMGEKNNTINNCLDNIKKSKNKIDALQTEYNKLLDAKTQDERINKALVDHFGKEFLDNSEVEKQQEQETEEQRLMSEIYQKAIREADQEKKGNQVDPVTMAVKQSETQVENKVRMQKESNAEKLKKINAKLRERLENKSDKMSFIFTDSHIEKINEVIKTARTISNLVGKLSQDGESDEDEEEKNPITEVTTNVGKVCTTLGNYEPKDNKLEEEQKVNYISNGITMLKDVSNTMKSVREKLEKKAEKAKNIADNKKHILDACEMKNKKYEEAIPEKEVKGREYIYAKYRYEINNAVLIREQIKKDNQMNQKILNNVRSTKEQLDKDLESKKGTLESAKTNYEKNKNDIVKANEGLANDVLQLSNELAGELRTDLKNLKDDMMEKTQMFVEMKDYCDMNRNLTKENLINKLQTEIDLPRPNNAHIQALSLMIVSGPENASNEINKMMQDYYMEANEKRQNIYQQKKDLDARRQKLDPKTDYTKEKLSFADLEADENSSKKSINRSRKPLEQIKQKKEPTKVSKGK